MNASTTTDGPFAVRPYEDRDREACLALFDSNLPAFFDPGEREEFEAYLDDLAERGPNAEYLVLETAGRVVACGGYYVAQSGTAGLAWGMVAQAHHREGFGTRLLTERLRRIAARPEARAVILDTSQRSRGFFERLGFGVVSVTSDGYGDGLDRVDMRLDLNDGTRDAILKSA